MFGEVAQNISRYNTMEKVDDFITIIMFVMNRSQLTLWLDPAQRTRECMKPKPNSYDFTHVYEFLFKEYDISFPLTDFEAGILMTMDIAPSQLHPRSLAYLKCFEIFCSHLDLEPSINVFTYFYQVKFGKFVGWVSLSDAYDSSLFTLYSSSYKHFKTKNFKFQCHLKDVEKRLLFHPDFTPRFPFYWQKPTRFKSQAKYLLTLKEREAIDTIGQLPRHISSRTLLSVPFVEDSDALFLSMA